MVIYSSIWGTAGTISSAPATLVNCSLLNLYDNDSMSEFVNNSSGNTTAMIGTYAITVTKANASISFTSANGTMTTPTWADLMVYQLPNPIN